MIKTRRKVGNVKMLCGFVLDINREVVFDKDGRNGLKKNLLKKNGCNLSLEGRGRRWRKIKRRTRRRIR